jgi:protein farnesyltransferase/geranylgeranyltransferase type-1 subunit alpha
MAGADSSSEELCDENNWVLYKDRAEWRDVTAVPQDDGPYPIVAISYSEKFKDIYDYFRAVLKLCEKSERALRLTADALELNPANYTVWQYRREILKHLNKDLIPELQYVKEMIENNPKNYQVWHHRRVLVEWLQDPSYELSFTEQILTQDPKNYHAWQHRQWVIRTFKLFQNELQYVDWLLDDDIRNNSAWNQRYFVINNTTGFTPDVIERELAFTLVKIKTVTNNESAWSYIRGVLFHHEGGISQDQNVKQVCEDLYSSGNRSPFLLAFLVDVCEESVQRRDGEKAYSLNRAIELCDLLAKEYDTIRREYWNYVARCLAQRMNCSQDEATGSSQTE